MIIIVLSVLCGQTVTYDISFPNAVHHEARVTVRWTGVTDSVLEAWMSRSSPGRYALHEFAKNVYDVSAVDSKGRTLTIFRPNPYQWNVSGHDGTVILSYTVFGDRVDGTYLGIDRSHAHINMPATFMWARGFDERPMTISFHLPKNSQWKIATQLKTTSEATTFTAPNLQYFMDSPTELSDYKIRQWTSVADGRTASFRLVIHSNDTPPYLDAYETMVKAVTAEHQALWGAFAPYDFGEYTFIADYLPYADRDGMEHRNSTILTSSHSITSDAVRLVDALSHEFFHSWNVERIRPKSLEPFDFTRVNMSGELWFAEGFTSYYGPLLVKRAGITSIDDFAKGLSNNLNYVLSSPGSKFSSAVDMSRYAPFADAATSIDATNRSNMFISYYNYGDAIALGLDLTIRSTFPGLSLDDMMRAMRKHHPDVSAPYTMDDLRTTLGAVVHDQAFADRFFKRYIEGKEFVDYAALLRRAGFVLRPADSGKASLGRVRMNVAKGNAVITSSPLINTPLYAAGVDKGDTLTMIDGKDFSSRNDIDSILAHHHPDDRIGIDFVQRGMKYHAEVVLEENSSLEVVPFETAGRTVTPAIDAFRQSWLGKKSAEEFPTLRKYCPECKRSYEFHDSFCPLDGTKLSIVPQQ